MIPKHEIDNTKVIIVCPILSNVSGFSIISSLYVTAYVENLSLSADIVPSLLSVTSNESTSELWYLYTLYVLEITLSFFSKFDTSNVNFNFCSVSVISFTTFPTGSISL